MSKYIQGTPTVKEIKNADFFSSITTDVIKEVKKKAKTKKKSESK